MSLVSQAFTTEFLPAGIIKEKKSQEKEASLRIKRLSKK